MSSKLTVVAHATAKPGKENQLKAILQGFVAPTRAEKGCLNYDLHQSLDQPGKFVFYENWTSKEALDAHLKTPHLTQGAKAAQEFLAEPIAISLWNPL